MTGSQKVFRIKIERKGLDCNIFWGCSHQPTFDFQFGRIQHNENLNKLYDKWQKLLNSTLSSDSTRGKKLKLDSSKRTAGFLASTQANSVLAAEDNLVLAFNEWLEEQKDARKIKDEIRQAIVEVQQSWKQQTETALRPSYSLQTVDVLIECDVELARLPWESWKLSHESTLPSIVRITRVPLKPGKLCKTVPYRSKLRVLALFGHANDLQQGQTEDQKNLEKHLQHVAKVSSHWCTPDPLLDLQQQRQQLIEGVRRAIAHEDGWDILLFSGHSDESEITSEDDHRLKGRLELAKHIYLELHDIEAELREAQAKGLRLVILNSCKGIQLADSLVRLGIGQVICWREVIQCRIANIFLREICSSLSRYKDIQSAFEEATSFLKGNRVSYPSAYLIPSLFRHPDAPLLRFYPPRLKTAIKGWQPSIRELVIISIFLLISILRPMRETLFNQRQWVQAVYRYMVSDSFSASREPSITVISIDQQSLEEANIDGAKVYPLDRSYLAQIVNRLEELNVKVIGIDYYFDRNTDEDHLLYQAIAQSIEKQSTWFVLASKTDQSKRSIRVASSVAEPNWFLRGDTEIGYVWDLMLPSQSDCQERCFSLGFQLVRAYQLSHLPDNHHKLYPQLQKQQSLQETVDTYINEHKNVFLDQQYLFLPGSVRWLVNATQRIKLHSGLARVDPVLDFSIPPQEVYTKIPAWDFLERPLDDQALQALSRRIVIIAADNYDGADDTDLTYLPPAIEFWRKPKRNLPPALGGGETFSGGEAHAYAVHQMLVYRALILFPDAWFIIIAAVLGKATLLWLDKQEKQKQREWMTTVAIAPVGYGLLGLQAYLFLGIWLPWFFPTFTFWLYLLSAYRQLSRSVR